MTLRIAPMIFGIVALAAGMAHAEPEPITFHDVPTDSTLTRDATPPEIDREALFRRFAAENLADPDAVKDVHMGPVYGGRINLFQPGWFICVAYNSKRSDGGYRGRRYYLFALGDEPHDGRYSVIRIYRRGEDKWRHNCSSFRAAVRDGA